VGFYVKIPLLTINERTNMDKLDKSIQELVTTAKISALYSAKEKIQDEIDELEKKVSDDEIPF
jgi:molybdopterin biosynthesis enzyme MoaB